MPNIGCGAVALWLDKRSIIILQPDGWENSQMYYAGNTIFVYAVAIFNLCIYSFHTHETFTVLRRNFCLIFSYAVTIFHFA